MTILLDHSEYVNRCIARTAIDEFTERRYYGSGNPMEVAFRDSTLDRLEVDAKFDAGLPGPVVKAFRKRMQHIRSADDERAFYGMKSLHFEKLKGNRQGQYSMKLNDQWRLIVELGKGGKKTVVEIVAIEDYH